MTNPAVLLVDTHAHIQDPAFDTDREAVLARAASAGVVAIVCVGYDVDSSRRAVELAATHASVYAAVGIHPNDCGKASRDDWQTIRQLARHPRVVGIGETGLDSYRDRTPAAVQEIWLELHLELAAEIGLPLIIHNRLADEPLRTRLGAMAQRRRGAELLGVMHCFSGDTDLLSCWVDYGFAISFAGTLTFKNAGVLQATAARAPLDRVVVETDSPFLTPHPYRGQRNEPAHLVHTARQLAVLQEQPLDILAERTTRTAAQLFGLEIVAPTGSEVH